MHINNIYFKKIDLNFLIFYLLKNMSYKFGKENKTGMFISPEECIRNIKLYQPIIKYKTQLKNEWRQKGFYKVVMNSKTHYLVPMETLFEIMYNTYGDDNFKEIIVEYDDFQIIYNSECNKFNNYLVGYTEDNTYSVTNFSKLPANVEYCYKNIINFK